MHEEGGAQHIREVFPVLQCTASMLLVESVPVVPAPLLLCSHAAQEPGAEKPAAAWERIE